MDDILRHPSVAAAVVALALAEFLVYILQNVKKAPLADQLTLNL